MKFKHEKQLAIFTLCRYRQKNLPPQLMTAATRGVWQPALQDSTSGDKLRCFIRLTCSPILKAQKAFRLTETKLGFLGAFSKRTWESRGNREARPYPLDRGSPAAPGGPGTPRHSSPPGPTLLRAPNALLPNGQRTSRTWLSSVLPQNL